MIIRKIEETINKEIPKINSQLEQINKQCYVARERYDIEINDNNIIDEAINNKKTNILFFPKREYEVSKTFYPKQGQKLFFNNCNMINKIENSVPIIQILESDVEIYDLFNINTINNNKIDNNTTQSMYGSTIVIGDLYNKELIKNVKIINCSSINSIGGVSAFICAGKVENIKFIDCYVNGTQIKSGEGFITGFHAEWNGADVLSCKNITMENCIVENFSSPNSYAFYISSVIQCTLKNCKAKNVNMGYILYDGDKGTEGDGVDNILVENCLVENYSGYGYSIKSRNNTDYDKIRVSIINCTAKNCTTDTGCPFRIYSNKGGVRLRDNKINGCYNAIIGDPTNGLIMEGNEFENVRNRNISFTQLQDSTISKNKFFSENINGEDIYLEFLSNNNDISDNDFIGTGSKFNIHLKSDANLSNNNKIHGNNFNATYGLVNGASTDLSKGLRTYVYNNRNKQDNPIYTGAGVYVNEGSKTKLYHTAAYEFPNSKIGDEVVNISPSVGQPMGWIKTAVGVMTPYNILS